MFLVCLRVVLLLLCWELFLRLCFGWEYLGSGRNKKVSVMPVRGHPVFCDYHYGFPLRGNDEKNEVRSLPFIGN